MNNKAWSHLPNAAYIDRILESLKTHNDIWTADFDAAWDAAWDATLDEARVAAWAGCRDAARSAAYDAAYDAAWDEARVAAWAGCRDAIAALIAWDDSAQFLEMTGDALEVWIRISDDPRAKLLLPAVRAFERIKELETL